MASPACMNMAGVPVEFKVAAIFVAIIALFPIPETITRPFDETIQFTASTNPSLTRVDKWSIAALSVSIVLLAMARILWASVKSRSILSVFVLGIYALKIQLFAKTIQKIKWILKVCFIFKKLWKQFVCPYKIT